MAGLQIDVRGWPLRGINMVILENVEDIEDLELGSTITFRVIGIERTRMERL